jgi:hypothetical protein
MLAGTGTPRVNRGVVTRRALVVPTVPTGDGQNCHRTTRVVAVVAVSSLGVAGTAALRADARETIVVWVVETPVAMGAATVVGMAVAVNPVVSHAAGRRTTIADLPEVSQGPVARMKPRSVRVLLGWGTVAVARA